MKVALQNKIINKLNLHMAFQRFADYMALTFFGPIYLYKIGLSIESIFWTWAGYVLLSSLLRPLAFYTATKIGLKKCIWIGSILFCGLYPVLGLVDGVNFWLLLFIIHFSFAEAFYWLCYHVYFTKFGDNHVRGKQIGIREILSFVAQILAPLLTIFLVANYSFQSVFWVAALICTFSLIPLWDTPEIYPKNTLNFKDAIQKVSKRGAGLYFGHSVWRHALEFTWVLVVFILLRDLVTFGIILSVSATIGAGLQYFIGDLIDKNQNTKTYLLGVFVLIFTIMLATFGDNSVPLIISVNVMIILANSLFTPFINTIHYNSSQKSHDSLWFQFFAETSYHIATLISCLFVVIFLYLGGELRQTILLGVAGVLIATWFIKGNQKFKNPKHLNVGKTHI